MKRILTLVVALGTATVMAADRAEIKSKNYSLTFEKGSVMIKDAGGRSLVRIGAVRFGWAPPVARPVDAEVMDGNRLKVSYKVEKDESGKIGFEAEYTCGENGVEAVYTATVPAKYKVGGAMLDTAAGSGVSRGKNIFKGGIWTRHDKGGIPYEVRGGYFRPYAGSTQTLWRRISGNVNYCNEWSEHLGFPEAKEDGPVSVNVSFLVLPKAWSGDMATALFCEKKASVTISTAKDFNLWESGAPEFKVTVGNPAAEALTAELKVWARDFDGKKVLEKTGKLDIPAGSAHDFSYVLPEMVRGIYFVEASVTAGGRELAFSRANMTVLPPHEFAHRKDSVFGMSAYFPIPSSSAVLGLMKRMGVHHLRNGDEAVAAKYDMVAFAHSSVGRLDKDSPAQMKKKLTGLVDEFMKRGNRRYEFCNEWNMAKGQDKKVTAARYVEWLKVLHEVKKERNADFKIIAQGIAGGDAAFLKNLHEAGMWPLVDMIAFHPGRGNFTPDYTVGSWTYLGAIRRMQKLNKEFGEKPMYLTEVYAATYPNSSWKDSPRHAAENVILTYAVGMAEGMASIQFYQLHDGRWHDHGGVNHRDDEYTYGMLTRNGEWKASALAYAAAAEALDGAKFEKELSFSADGMVRVLGFSTPRGKLAFVYDRTDGFVLSEKSPDFFHPEAWVDSWKTRRDFEFPSRAKEVTVVDVIGRAKAVPVVNGKVTLNVSGAPLMVYGLEF